MPKRFRFFIASAASAVGLLFLLSLPFEWRYVALGALSLGIIILSWFAEGVWKESWMVRIMISVLPVLFFGGYSLFLMLLPFSVELGIFVSLLLAFIFYIVYLVENIFLVALAFKTVPLYRAAWTVNLLLTLLASFFIFNSLWSFRFFFGINALIAFLVGLLLFAYLYWVISIETELRERKDVSVHVIVPALVVGELGLVLSFWPVGIFNASIYLVWAVFILGSLLQVDLRERLFRKTWIGFAWITVAVILSLVVTTSWR